MYRNAVLQTLNRRLFSAILKKLFEAARNAHIDPYTSKGVFSVHQLRVLIEVVKDSYQTFLIDSDYPKPSSPSVTLISKVLMGVMGVLPAFDTCFRAQSQSSTLKHLKAVVSPISSTTPLSRPSSTLLKTSTS